ncbi:MAG: DUF3445 domain-containing protein [Pyrinomonadaceae bacterium]
MSKQQTDTLKHQSTLAAPARYFPLEKGLYEVVAGLKALGADFGNGEIDARVFQIDCEFAKYRSNKLRCRAERLDKYYATANYTPALDQAIARFLLKRFVTEYPQLFSCEILAGGKSALRCELTGEVLIFDAEMKLIEVRGSDIASRVPEYASAFDGLCSQVPEDIAVVSLAPEGNDYLTAIHLCSPSHWAAEDKIGKNFTAIHAPVPGIERINRTAPSLVDAMINKGPFVRFAWGITGDTRLNHHPQPPPGLTIEQWRGRTFQAKNASSPFALRIERQVLHGLPELNAALFAIRVYFISGEEIRANERERALLRAALLSMTPESRAYKGLDENMEDVIAWLDNGSAASRGNA